MAIGGVSTIGSDADLNDECPGRLLAWVATDDPLGTSSPVKFKSTLLSDSWLNGVLLFKTSSKYSSIKPSHEFRFGEEDEEDETDYFCGESGLMMNSVNELVIVFVGIGFPLVKFPLVVFF